MHGANWDGQKVRDRLVTAFRLAPGLVVYSPRKDILISIAEQGPVDGLVLMVMVGHALDKHRCDRVLAWARARAQGQSTADWCRELLWTRASLYKATEDVAEWLNARSGDGVPKPWQVLTTATFLVS